MDVIFYTKPNCPLCDEAKLMLELTKEDYPLTYTEINIESDDTIHEKYMLMIPVIEKNGKPILFGTIGYVELISLFD
ncbi:glutaredoxin family protein [Sporosarcina sp. CAU 1771]